MRLSARTAKYYVAFVLLFAFIGSILILPFQTLAFSDNTSTDYKAPNTAPDVPRNLHTYTQNALIETMAAISCQVIGIDPTNPKAKCLGADPKTGQIGFVESGGGAIGATTGLIGMLMTPPVNVSQYTNYLATNFGIKKSLATNSPENRGCENGSFPGTGWCALKPLLNLWTTFRNLVYLFFTIVFLFIGMAIMLRVKIDPRTVMTIQNSIPKIIIGLVLITFSYAIAAFFVDLMYSVTYVAVNILEVADPNIAPGTGYKITTATSPLEAASNIGNPANFASGTAGNIGDSLTPFFDNNPGKVIAGALTYFISQQAGSSFVPKEVLGFDTTWIINIFSGVLAVGVGASGAGLSLLSGIAKLIIFLILTIALLWALLRIWFVLLTSYIFILFDVILGPFWILAGIIPGGRAGIGGWLRDLASHLAVFPAAVIMFLLGRIFVDAFAVESIRGQFVPPMIGAFNYQTLGAIIGMGIIFSTPEVLNLTRALFKAPKVSLGGGFGKAIGAGTGVIGTGGKISWGQLNKRAGYHNPAGLVRRRYIKLGQSLQKENSPKIFKLFGQAITNHSGPSEAFGVQPDNKLPSK